MLPSGKAIIKFEDGSWIAVYVTDLEVRQNQEHRTWDTLGGDRYTVPSGPIRLTVYIEGEVVGHVTTDSDLDPEREIRPDEPKRLT